MIVVKVGQRLNTAQRRAVKEALNELARRDVDFNGASFRLYTRADAPGIHCTNNGVGSAELARVQTAVNNKLLGLGL